MADRRRTGNKPGEASKRFTIHGTGGSRDKETRRRQNRRPPRDRDELLERGREVAGTPLAMDIERSVRRRIEEADRADG